MNKLKTLNKTIIAFAIMATAGLTSSVYAALQTAGPISTSHGFPAWYQDTTGLALQPCLGVNADGTGLADPNCVMLPDATYNTALPVNFPTNFPGEFFYYIADADTQPVGPAQKNMAFRLALEGTFSTGAPKINDQLAFLRINLRFSKPEGLVPNSTYDVTHPFGTFSCTTDVLGSIVSCADPNGNGGAGSQAYRVEDLTGTPITSVTANLIVPATVTGFGPFLKAVSPLPPAGYIGNPNIAQTIQAGPNGANLVVRGPSIDPNNVDGDGNPNVMTVNNWFVAGKIAVIDTIPPVINATNPIVATVGSTNVVASTSITDNLGVTSVSVDLGPLGSSLVSTLNSSQEVPSTTSTGSGSGTFTIDTVANTLSFNITSTGLVGGAETAAHIHGPADVGVNALPLFTLPLGASKIGVWNYPEASEADILAGRTYVNIHTVLFPNGEIRGQITPQSNIQNMILTSGLKTNGTWGVIIPSVDRLGSFNLPLTVTDGSNVTTGSLILNSVPVLNSVNVTSASSTVITGLTEQLNVSGLDLSGTPITTGLTTTWTSSNSLVAGVSGTGLVTAVASGTATITATVSNGINTVPGALTITVVDGTPLPSVCQTGADIDANNIISNLEILNYVRDWKSGNVLSLLLLQAIGFWKVGAGC